jgi:hypothetical protein
MHLRLSSAVIALTLVACADDGQDDAASLLFPLDFANSYPVVRDCRGTVDHGFGSKITVAVNPAAQSAYVEGTYPLALGTTLVKTIYDDDGSGGCSTITGYAVMKKIRATTGDASADDWAWQETDAAGKPLAIVVGKCTSCHTSCTDGRDLTCTDP